MRSISSRADVTVPQDFLPVWGAPRVMRTVAVEQRWSRRDRGQAAAVTAEAGQAIRLDGHMPELASCGAHAILAHGFELCYFRT